MTALVTEPLVDDLVPSRAAGESPWQTVRRGLKLTPEFRAGLPLTLALALVATAGRVVVPIAVQQTIDHGLRADGGVDLPLVRKAVALSIAALLLTAIAGYLTNARLARSSETALSALRVQAFRHVHDLSMLHQATERRGTLVSRVTADVDSVSEFMSHGGIHLLVSVAQLFLATALMLFYSWQLTVLVILVFVPLAWLLQRVQAVLADRYGLVRKRLGEMLGAIAESVVGAPVIRAYGTELRTGKRVDAAIDAHADAYLQSVRVSSVMFSLGEIFAAIAVAGVVLAGVSLGVDGGLSEGRLIAFLFLVSLFISPVQTATEVLNEAQSAAAGWRRVLDILDVEPDVADPAAHGRALPLPPGPLGIRFEHVAFRYPTGPPVLSDVDVDIAARAKIAVVGATGSGKTTFAKLLTRLMDPGEGRVLVGGVPIDRVAFTDLRKRIVLVPQDGMLFDVSVAANVRHGRESMTDDEVSAAFAELGLGDWLETLPAGAATPVGERGEALSVGERQLVALVRAYVANPDILVLDEATSSVDPATEVRLQRALERVAEGRTEVTIAHRLSTAELADEILVFDAGRIVQRGSHGQLVGVPGVYAQLYASWVSRPS
ncbi:MAG: ABC transporter ATP-binding protein [Mycobacteriales bacterium]